MLNHGCVQEEILFITHPELLPSLLFFEKLSPNESAFFANIHAHSTYNDYSYNF